MNDCHTLLKSGKRLLVLCSSTACLFMCIGANYLLSCVVDQLRKSFCFQNCTQCSNLWVFIYVSRLLPRITFCLFVFRFSDETLANILSVKSVMFSENFSVKINDIIFVSHPVSLRHKSRESSMHSFHVVFALHVSTCAPIYVCSSSFTSNILSVIYWSVCRAIVKSIFLSIQAAGDECHISNFYHLAKQLTNALHHEETRSGYLSAQKEQMSAILDDVASCPEG